MSVAPTPGQPPAASPTGDAGAALAAAWSQAARTRLAALPLEPAFEERGRVHATADGIVTVTGLPGARLNELLRFSGGRVGYAASLEEQSIACVVLDDPRTFAAGEAVRRSGDVMRVPVGEALLGRIVDPLGRPLDDDPAVDAAEHWPVDRPAPTVLDRAPVREPVHTGTLVVDALFPIGRGQRELVIGDRGTGKTTLALDTIVAQRDSDMVCVYIAVGQKSESTAGVIAALRQAQMLARSIVVVGAGTDAPGLQWLAPFAGFTMAEWFRDRGRHALVVVDDLSQHAATHRELALLMRQPPGREAYPGDIFHVHARLLERAAKLSAARGGGSLTALPIARTEAGNLAAYIPTNLISITDGQIVLDDKQFHLGQLPAVDTGLSVSRVGGKTQPALLREIVGSLRLDYAQFLELEAFTRFGTELDAQVRVRIARGRRIRAALAQPRLSPRPPALQVAVLVALQDGLLDDREPQAVQAAVLALARGLAAAPELGARLSGPADSDRKALSAAVARLLAQA